MNQETQRPVRNTRTLRFQLHLSELLLHRLSAAAVEKRTTPDQVVLDLLQERFGGQEESILERGLEWYALQDWEQVRPILVAMHENEWTALENFAEARRETPGRVLSDFLGGEYGVGKVFTEMVQG